MAGKKEIIIVGGLGYGDEGKGSIVDYLVRKHEANLIVRYNGGAQAGHRVVLANGREHVFSQFGSGSFVPGVRTFLSRFMVINPLNMIREEEHLQRVGITDAFKRALIDEDALVTTPFQTALNRLSELCRGQKRYGSCGLGVGQTLDDYQKYGNAVLFAKDLSDPILTEKKINFLKNRNRETANKIISSSELTENDRQNIDLELAIFDDEAYVEDLVRYFLHFAALVNITDRKDLKKLFRESPATVFEGAQGMLLDKHRGFWPYVTKTDTSFNNAYKIIKDANCLEKKIIRIGVIRGYLTRHGRGPFVSEDEILQNKLTEHCNAYNPWQEKFRIGWFDILAVKYGIFSTGGVDFIALTNLDRFSCLEKIKVCVSYKLGDEIIPMISLIKGKNGEPANILFQCKPEYLEFSNFEPRTYVNFLEKKLDVPIKIISFGPTAEDKILV